MGSHFDCVRPGSTLPYTFALLLSTALLSCQEVTTTSPEVAGITIELERSSLPVNATDTVTATLLSSDGGVLSGRRVDWRSSNPAVIEVRAIDQGTKATVVGRAPGDAEITAESDGVEGRAALTVTNEPPLVAITSPTMNASYFTGDTIAFSGFADDPEEGLLPDSALSWISSWDGELGTGEVLERADLSAGTHWIVLTGTDFFGAVARDSVQISVNPNTEPTARIISPQDGASFAYGDPVTFEGAGDDAEDGTLTGESLVWTSSRDGQIGTGAVVERSDLSAGAHTITLTATDSRGASDTATIAITVEENEPPSAQITSPEDGSEYGDHYVITFAGDAVDPEDGVLSGDALVWTSSLTGQIGIGETFASELPRGAHTITLTATDGSGATGQSSVDIQVYHSWDAISAGGDHSCGVDSDGMGYCWGQNGIGEVGDGTQTTRYTPTAISGALILESIDAGINHTCAVDQSGAPYCWGSNNEGELGDGTGIDRSTPSLVDGSLEVTVISAGSNHTCAVTTTGAAYCWGENSAGQLGDGTNDGRDAPVGVSGAIQFSTITAGWGHTCGLATDGTAYCWGSNDHGQLGDGTANSGNTPQAVDGGFEFTSISAGWQHTCAVTGDGTGYCWGANDRGQLGNGTTTAANTPSVVSDGITFTSISAGYQHSCGLSNEGTVFCWGSNTDGELGDGTNSDRTTPTAVAGQRQYTRVSAGGFTRKGEGSFSCAVTQTGVAYCWGINIAGQLGNGTDVASNVPTRVLDPE